MGGSAINFTDMKKHYVSHGYSRAMNATQVFRSSRMFEAFDPQKMKLPREACDSADSPHSKGIIFAEDVTGSMDYFLLSLIKDEFPRLIKQTYDSVSYNPHIMFMGVGDVAAGDRAPLQVTQFETDLRILDQLEKIYLERGGGGNNSESYILPWYFAAKHIRMDCFDKRKEKGFLFTFGDECPTLNLTRSDITTVFGSRDTIERARLSNQDCLDMASEKFYCYHIILRGSFYGLYSQKVVSEWKMLMGGHACDISDHKYMPELVSTILRMYEGMTKTEAIDSIEDIYARDIVRDALKDHEEKVEIPKTSVNKPNIEIFD